MVCSCASGDSVFKGQRGGLSVFGDVQFGRYLGLKSCFTTPYLYYSPLLGIKPKKLKLLLKISEITYRQIFSKSKNMKQKKKALLNAMIFVLVLSFSFICGAESPVFYDLSSKPKKIQPEYENCQDVDLIFP